MASQTKARSCFKLGPIPALLAVALVTPGLAYAADDDQTTTVEKVTVTGSNIRRTDAETPSPVQVLTHDDLLKSGYTEISDVLRNISANGEGTLSQSFGLAFAQGASGISLRGLNLGSTLVLIDGHRVAPYALADDGQRHFVDISNIPIGAIDRIEVLKDGASSIYGSDAVAGVVNIILRKNYVGTEMTIDYGVTSKSDGRTTHASAITGWGDLDADGHNAYITAEYRTQDAIYLRDRSYLSGTNYSGQGGINVTPGQPTILNGGYAGSLTGYFIDPTSGAITGFLPGCNLAAYNAAKCQYTTPGSMIQPSTSQVDLLGSFTQRLSGDWQVHLTGSVFDSRDTQNDGFGGTNGPFGFVGVAVGPGIAPHLLNGGNPYFALVPATYPGNPTGIPQYLQANFPGLYGKDTADSTAYRFNAEVTGTLIGWDVSLNTGFSESVVNQYITGSINYPNLVAALANPVTPYRVGNFFYLNSAAANAAVAPAQQSQATSKLDYLSLGASRDVFNLWGGAAALSVGVDLRHESEDATAAPGIAAGVQPGNNAFAVGTTDVNSVYGEMSLPILKMLEVDISGRYDDYTKPGSFSSTTPKIGFKLTPIDILTIRGTYAEGFRAPNTNEEGELGESFLANSVTDPILCPVAPTAANPKPAGDFQQYCAFQTVYLQGSGHDLKPETSRSYTFGFILEPVKQFNLSVDYFQIKDNNEITSAFEDPTFNPFTNAVRGASIVTAQNTAAGGTVNVLTPVGPISYLPVPYENVAYTKVQGLDIDANLKFDLGDWGKIHIEGTETHMFHYYQAYGAGGTPLELTGTHGPSGIGGDTANPKDRAQLTINYERGPWSFTGTVNYIGPYSVTDPTAGLDTCQVAIAFSANGFFANTGGNGGVPTKYCNVSSFTTFDTYLSYKLDKHWVLHASILNLFNQNAPLDLETYGGGGGTGVFAPYNPSLAQSGATGRFYQVGASYKF